MNNEQWNKFFETCSQVLGKGSHCSNESESWCSWITFSRLNMDAGYWISGVPNINEITQTGIKDGGTWGQPFLFEEIAHIIIPKKFYWESGEDFEYKSGYKLQNIELLSCELIKASVPHKTSNWALEIKCF